MKRVLMVLISVLWLTPIQASESLMISDLGTSAKQIAMGNIEGFNGDASVVFDNPACLEDISKYSVSMFGTTLMEDAKYSSLSAAVRTKYGVFGLGYTCA